MINNSPLPTNVPLQSTRSTPVAQERIGYFMTHAYSLLENLKKQNETAGLSAEKAKEIYQKAEKGLTQLHEKLDESVFHTTPKLNKQINDLNKELIKAQNENKKIQEMVSFLNDGLFQFDKHLNEDEINSLNKHIEAETKKLDESNEKVEELSNKLKNLKKSLSKEDLSSKEIKNFSKNLKKAESTIVEIIYQSQIDVISSSATKEVKEQMIRLTKGGVRAQWVKFLAYFSVTHEKAVDYFNHNLKAMENASKREIEKKGELSQVDLDKFQEYDNYRANKGTLAHRAGVIGLNGIYPIQVSFSKEYLKKQLKSFIIQNSSDIDRKIIEKKLVFNGYTLTNRFTPINDQFDKSVAIKKDSSDAKSISVFSRIFGTKGIATTNRQESHLVNGYVSELIGEGIDFSVFRHGIISSTQESNPKVRKDKSKQAAEELYKALIMQEIKSQGLTLNEAKEKVIELNVNSVSLVTPDAGRPFFRAFLGLFGKGKNIDVEKTYLKDQITALKSFQTDQPQSFNLDGVNVQVKVNVNAFNFGVNEGAVKGKYGQKYGLGTQYQYNQNAFKGLQSETRNFYKKAATGLRLLEELKKSIEKNEKEIENLKKELTAASENLDLASKQNSDDFDQCLAEVNQLNWRIEEIQKSLHLLPTINKQIAQIQQSMKDTAHLMDDIALMMGDKEAYLKGENQYEIGAKILNVTSIMNKTITKINQFSDEKVSGSNGTVNCKSGKDRTGIMDGVAKTFAIMAKTHGHYLSQKEFMDNPTLRRECAQILEKILLEGGGLEISYTNTGAKGYKVKGEARLFGMSIETFLQLQGIAETTAA